MKSGRFPNKLVFISVCLKFTSVKKDIIDIYVKVSYNKFYNFAKNYKMIWRNYIF